MLIQQRIAQHQITAVIFQSVQKTRVPIFRQSFKMRVIVPKYFCAIIRERITTRDSSRKQEGKATAPRPNRVGSRGSLVPCPKVIYPDRQPHFTRMIPGLRALFLQTLRRVFTNGPDLWRKIYLTAPNPFTETEEIRSRSSPNEQGFPLCISAHCGSITCPGDGFLGKDCTCWCPGSPVLECGGGEVTGSTVSPVTDPPDTSQYPTRAQFPYEQRLIDDSRFFVYKHSQIHFVNGKPFAKSWEIASKRRNQITQIYSCIS